MWIFIFYFIIILTIYSLLFPFTVYALAVLFRKKDEASRRDYGSVSPMVSILVTCHDDKEDVAAKAVNLKEIDYPLDKLEIIFAIDGSDNHIAVRLQPFTSENIRYIQFPDKRGKIHAVNHTLPLCKGEIVVFTDVDAILAPDSIQHLVSALSHDDNIGGGCGMHLISSGAGDDKSTLKQPQKFYWSMDYLLKTSENRMGSISSCYGTIYAIKKELFTPIPLSVTDDAFQAMAIVRKGKRFVFVSEARAYIHPPSKNPDHELERRKRIITQSLRGLWISRELFNIKRFGFYSVSLFSYKVLRRLLPVFLIYSYIYSMARSADPGWFSFFVGQTLFYLIAYLEWVKSPKFSGRLRTVNRISSLILYFCIGNLGIMMGIIKFLIGGKINTWETY